MTTGIAGMSPLATCQIGADPDQLRRRSLGFGLDLNQFVPMNIDLEPLAGQRLFSTIHMQVVIPLHEGRARLSSLQ